MGPPKVELDEWTVQDACILICGRAARSQVFGPTGRQSNSHLYRHHRPP